jgi:hypothetical protein
VFSTEKSFTGGHKKKKDFPVPSRICTRETGFFAAICLQRKPILTIQTPDSPAA